MTYEINGDAYLTFTPSPSELKNWEQWAMEILNSETLRVGPFNENKDAPRVAEFLTFKSYYLISRLASSTFKSPTSSIRRIVLLFRRCFQSRTRFTKERAKLS